MKYDYAIIILKEERKKFINVDKTIQKKYKMNLGEVNYKIAELESAIKLLQQHEEE